MIKYNNTTINDWNYGSDNLKKVYYHNAVCYYKIGAGGTSPTAQTPCFAVVYNIANYQDTEFQDVYNKADSSWYKLNNLNQYEKYGVMGSGRDITTYEGKLTVDEGIEYQYTGGVWTSVGEVTGSTATLPDVPFSVNINARAYDAVTKTFARTEGQLVDTDITITAGTPAVGDGYITVQSKTRAVISGYSTYFNRSDDAPNLTIISKQRTEGRNCHMFANRASYYNWMYRVYADKLTLHGGVGEHGEVAVTTQPVTESVRVDSSRTVTYNNYTDDSSSTEGNFSYGSTNNEGFALFAGYSDMPGEWFVGDFYWVYMSQNTLTDEQVRQVILFNENYSPLVLPVSYSEIAAPPTNVTFQNMAEALAYQCPYVGLDAIIGGKRYVFNESNEWEVNSRKSFDFTIDDVNTTSSVSLEADGYYVISFKNNDSYSTPEYMMSYETGSTPYLSNFERNTGLVSLDDSVIIDAAVWILESVPNSADTYYIKNVANGKYFGYQGRSSSYSLILVDDNEKIPVIVTRVTDGYFGIVEAATTTSSNGCVNGGYGLNQLNSHTYQLNWWNTSASDCASFFGSDGNAEYVFYKVNN